MSKLKWEWGANECTPTAELGKLCIEIELKEINYIPKAVSVFICAIDEKEVEYVDKNFSTFIRFRTPLDLEIAKLIAEKIAYPINKTLFSF